MRAIVLLLAAALCCGSVHAAVPRQIAGASAAATWIHGRTLIVVGGSPVFFAVSPVVGTASVTSAGSAVGYYLVRLTILKIS